MTDDGATARLAGAISRHPREFVGIVMATVAIFAIFINALFLQNGPHPAPIFAARPLLHQAVPAASPRQTATQPIVTPDGTAQSRARLIADIQRELGRKGFYDGAADGIWGAKTDAATRDFVQAAGLKINPEASDGLLRAIVSNAKAPSGRAGACAQRSHRRVDRAVQARAGDPARAGRFRLWPDQADRRLRSGYADGD